MSSQRSDGEDSRIHQARGHLLHMAEDVGHDHATFGVSVIDSHPGTWARGKNLVSDVGILTTTVAHQTDGDDYFQVRRLQKIHRLEMPTTDYNFYP